MEAAAGQAAAPVPFIVGTGRSGTTLLRMMLDAHSQLAIPPETERFLAAALKVVDREGAFAAIEAGLRAPGWSDFNVPAEELIERACHAQPENLGEAMRVLYRLYAERRGKPRWGDKSPYYVRAIGLIHRHLPEARFVHVIRDGRDVALSMSPLWFGPNDFAEIARWWVDTLAVARRQAERVPHYVEIRYEALVRDPAGTLRELCGLLDLDWEPAMLDYHRDAGERLAAETGDLRMHGRVVSRTERLGIHRLLSSPPQESRLERWRSEMSAADRRIFEREAGDVLAEIGYDVGC